MDEIQLKALLEKYTNGTCSKEEIILLESWYLKLYKQDKLPAPSLQELRSYQDLIWQDVQQQTGIDKKLAGVKTFPLWPRIAAAASIILCLSIGSYFLLRKQSFRQIAQNQIHDIAPGGNKAVLTLGNGKKIVLTGAQNGKLAVQGNIAIDKTTDGEVIYHNGQNAKLNAEMVYDTLTIPRGGQYQLNLADGSKVWLNSATSIRYPENFTGNERKVELITGEAYFEVVHNARMPFRVVAAGQTVEDIGTHFNINAYEDESVIKTTLLEGSVKIYRGSENAILQPGQQSQVGKTSGIKVISGADTEEAVAWKNGYFLVNDSDMASIMRQLARWYDIKVVFEGKCPTTLFHFKVSRNLSLVEMLKIFELNDVNFKIEGRTLIVKS